MPSTGKCLVPVRPCVSSSSTTSIRTARSRASVLYCLYVRPCDGRCLTIRRRSAADDAVVILVVSLAFVAKVTAQPDPLRCIVTDVIADDEAIGPGDYLTIEPPSGPQLALVEAMSGDAGSYRFTCRLVTAKPLYLLEAYVRLPEEDELRVAFDVAGSPIEFGEIAKVGVHIPVRCEAKAIAENHSAVFGLSGTGKTTLLGRILEEVLLHHASTQIVVVDPNSDFSKFGTPLSAMEVNQHGDCAKMPAAAIATDQAKLNVKPELIDKPLLNIARFTPDELLRVVQQSMSLDARLLLDRIRKSLEIVQRSVTGSALEQELAAIFTALNTSTAHPVLDELATWVERIHHRNAGLEALHFARELSRSEVLADVKSDAIDAATHSTHRFVELNVARQPTAERAFLTAEVLRALWNRNLDPARRRNTLIVIDEAHNIVPAGITSASGEWVNRIASEGRKYALRLMLVSQRPAKIHPDALDNCRNITVLRIQNQDDLDALARRTAEVSPALMSRVALLPDHHALIYGPTAAPVVVRTGRRRMA